MFKLGHKLKLTYFYACWIIYNQIFYKIERQVAEMPLILGRSETQYVAMVTKKLNAEKADRTVGLTVVYFPIFRQAQPDFFR